MWNGASTATTKPTIEEHSVKLNLTIELWKKGRWYVARSPEFDFISQGKTGEEARKNLEEVIRIQFEEMTDDFVRSRQRRRHSKKLSRYRRDKACES